MSHYLHVDVDSVEGNKTFLSDPFVSDICEPSQRLVPDDKLKKENLPQNKSLKMGKVRYVTINKKKPFLRPSNAIISYKKLVEEIDGGRIKCQLDDGLKMQEIIS